MDTRARRAPSNEDGFILIEVLVSAIILALVAGAVLTLITATTRSAASARNHSTAYGLAQEDQARMRTLRISTLKNYRSVSEPTLNGTKFVVESRAFFVNSKSGTASCTEQNASADYVQITSTVSAAAMPNPVSLQSIVSPSSGSLDPGHGTLAFQVNNARDEPVSGVAIASSGSSNPGAFSGSSEASGCAIFADLPAGNYKVTANGNGLVTPEGSSTWTKEQVGVPASGTQQVIIHFDRAGKVIPSFVYKDPATGSSMPALVDSMELFNSENENKAVTFGTPRLSATGRSSTLQDESVYPFKTKYLVYAGSCTTSNPDPESKGLNAAAVANLLVTPGSESRPQLQIPALNLGVTYNGAALQGAKVVLTDTSCKYNGSYVKREFTTNSVGHIVNSSSEAGTGTLAVGLPFGTYKICVSAYYQGAYRKNEPSAPVEVKNLSTAATSTVSLSGGGATSSYYSYNQC